MPWTGPTTDFRRTGKGDFMSEEKTSFDSVAEGPQPSEGTEDAPTAVAEALPDHATVSALKDAFGDAILRHEVSAGDQHIVFVPPERSLEILTWLKTDPDQAYDLLRDVTAIDYGGGQALQMVYQLFSLAHKLALRVKCDLPLDALEIESVYPVWKAANWLEREVFDLFGITFLNHPDLRRILMPDDYEEGYPLRKDFPLRGRHSRAEQTRKALSQDLGHYYIMEEIEMGGDSQALPPSVAELEAGTGEEVAK